MADNEVLNKRADATLNSNRAYPKALDVFAAFGVKSAAALLDTCYHEKENRKNYPVMAGKMKRQFQGRSVDTVTMYDRWMEVLIELQRPNKDYPCLMQTSAWQIKNLYTALASWTGLKHDVILYGEQLMLTEGGSGGEFGHPGRCRIRRTQPGFLEETERVHRPESATPDGNGFQR